MRCRSPIPFHSNVGDGRVRPRSIDWLIHPPTWSAPHSLFLFSPMPVVVERTASFLAMDVHICRSTVLGGWVDGWVDGWMDGWTSRSVIPNPHQLACAGGSIQVDAYTRLLNRSATPLPSPPIPSSAVLYILYCTATDPSEMRYL